MTRPPRQHSAVGGHLDDHVHDHSVGQDFDWSWTNQESDWVPPPVDPSRVTAARIYDCLLDGKDHYAADRAALERLLQIAPYAKPLARANRSFVHTAVRLMVRDHGIRQILDLGTGLPARPTVHEVAAAESPGVRVIYVDNDPAVAAQNRALLATEPGTGAVLHDLREPDAVLQSDQISELIDFGQPVGLLFVAVLHFVAVDQAPAVMARYRDLVGPGSCLAVSAVSRDHSDPRALRAAQAVFQRSATPLHPRSTAQIEQLFEGFRLTTPLIGVAEWGATPDAGLPPGTPASILAGLAVKD